jgi:hypothetical protein
MLPGKGSADELEGAAGGKVFQTAPSTLMPLPMDASGRGNPAKPRAWVEGAGV